MTEDKKLIAFMGGLIDEEKNCNFIREMEKECAQNGYLMLVFAFSETTFAERFSNNCEIKLIELAGYLDLKAIIMHLEFIKSDYLVEAIKALGRKKGIPVIAMERPHPDCINITMRYRHGFADMVRHVIDVHGCRKVNMIAGLEGDHFSDDRIRAYKQVLEEKGIPFEESRLGYGQFWDRPARFVTRKFIESGDIPDAIVCANDNMAIAVCDELQKLGYKVPEDIIVTGFDGVKKCLFKKPAISTVEPDYKSEVHRLMELIKQGDTENLVGSVAKVDFLLKLRDSCGCNRSEDALSTEDIMDLFDSYEDVNWAVTNINSLFSQASHLESLRELTEVIQSTLWLWARDFQYVVLYTDLLRPEIPDLDGKEYTSFFSYINGKKSGIARSFDADEALPGFLSMINRSDFHVMIVKLLHAGNNILGYSIEGTKNTTGRDVRRCEEFGMFLSTAIHTVVANRTLAQMNREFEQISIMDYLTGIFNRRGFFNELDRLLAVSTNKGKYLTVFSIDMDGLKHINDFYGHAEGDFALQRLACALEHIVSRNGICARYGGDEFACALISDEPITLSPDELRSRLDNVLMKRDDVKDKEYEITASVGCASAPIDNNLDLEELFGRSDEGMYADKKLKHLGKVRGTSL
jgi:diguanylate cyclase (GGDEF)-like protein